MKEDFNLQEITQKDGGLNKDDRFIFNKLQVCRKVIYISSTTLARYL